MSDDKKPLQQALRDAWSGALGLMQGRGTEDIGKALHELVDAVNSTEQTQAVRELVERVRQNRDQLERRVEEGVHQAVSRVSRPLEKELASVRLRVEALQRRVEELGRKKP